MTVKDLIKELKKLDQDALVVLPKSDYQYYECHDVITTKVGVNKEHGEGRYLYEYYGKEHKLSTKDKVIKGVVIV